MLTKLLKRPVTWLVLAAGVVVLTVGLALFQPWKLWVDQTVDEAPIVAIPPAAADGITPGGPSVLARGTLISHEHDTTGTVQVVQAADGSRYLRLENLNTSNGPLLKVWLTDAPVKPGKDGWGVFDDGRYADLGALKGNKGSQNYALPADVNLARYRSVSIWCARFHVSFGAAELTRP